MDLFLRKVVHPQAHDTYRVIWKDDGLVEVEIGAIGVQHGSGGDGRQGLVPRRNSPERTRCARIQDVILSGTLREPGDQETNCRCRKRT